MGGAPVVGPGYCTKKMVPPLTVCISCVEMRVRHIGDRARTVELSGKTEFALDDVPDLREIVPVQREGRTRRVFEKSCIGFRRTLRPRVEQEFGDISKSSRFPFHVGGVLELWRVMRTPRTHRRILLFCLTRSIPTRSPVR